MRGIRLDARLKCGLAITPVLLLATAVQAGAPAVKGDTNATRARGGLEDSIEVVVVTARKRQENIQAIPESIQAFSAQNLQDAHITSIDDLGTFVPNLNITTRFDKTPDVVLRGIGSFGVTQGVGFFMDGVQLFDGETVRREDIERVEVLEGPQGTLYGGANIGGAIKYITKRPTDHFEGELSAEYGSYATRTFFGAVSGPLGSENFKGRLSLFDSETGGYIFDPILNEHLDSGKERGGRATFEYDHGATTATLYLSGDFFDTGGANLYYRPASPTDYSLQVLDGTRPSYKRGLYSATLNLKHEFADGLALTSITSYMHSNEKVVTDVDKGPLPFLTGYQHFQRNVWSEELQLENSGDGPFTWLVGLYAQGNDPDLLTRTHAFIGDPPSDANLADPAQYVDQFTDARQTHREYAIYANGQYQWKKWSFELGLRADYNDSTMTDPLYALKESQNGTEILPRASASYHFDKDVMAYATVSRGFEPGDMQEGFDVNGNPIISTYKPETTTNYETGVKSTLFGNMRFNVAAFYDKYDNRLFQTYKLESLQFVQVIENIGSSDNYGAEVDLSAYVMDNLLLAGSFGVTSAVWNSVSVYDPDLNQQTNLQGRSGPDTPTYQGSLSADWSHEIGNGILFGARLDVGFFGPHYWDITNHFRQPAYQLVNVGLRLERGGWELSGHVSNLFDARYLTAFVSAAEIQGPFNVGGIGAPQLWSVALTYKF